MSPAGSLATPRRLVARAFVPVVSLLLLAAMFALVLGTAGATLGYDYRAYEGASRALLDGKPMYENAFAINGGTGPDVYLYPPTFAVALVPWLSLGGAAAGLWSVAMALCFVAGVAMLPVRRDVRWLIVIVAALDWPLLYAVKLGQVEPILFLGFAAAWRGIDRAGVVGTAAAVGALIKVQPGLLVVWAIATRRFRAVAVAVAIGVALVAVTTVFTGVGAWASYVDLLRGMGGDFSTPHNFAPGAVAHLAGASDGMATVVQLASVALAVAALALALRYAPADISLLITILASQLISSPLRDHYAVLLLLPTAYLVQRGKNWAVMFPLLGWATLFADGSSNAWLATASVSLTFFGCLAVLLWEARQQRGSAPIHVAPAYA